MLSNSLALVAGKLISLGLGFFAWLLAARLFPPDQVGLASAVIAAMMLCVQVALLGVGSAVIALLPRHATPGLLVATAIALVTGTAALVALAFIAFAGVALQELRPLAQVPLYGLMFLVLTIAGTLGVLFDQTSTALTRAVQMTIRSVVGGVLTLVAILAVWQLGGGDAWAIVLAWVVAAVVTVLVGLAQLRPVLARSDVRLRGSRPLARELLSSAAPNFALTLAERAPGTMLPIVVTEMLSPTSNAAWYAAWMMAWVVYVIPIQVGINVFAEASHRPEQLAGAVRHGVATSLALGVVGALGLALFAPFALSLLGDAYAGPGTLPLRILLIGVVPVAIIQAYFAVCRSTRRLAEAVGTAVVGALAVFAGATVAAPALDLPGVAVVFVAIQGAAAVWAAARLAAILGGSGTSSSQAAALDGARPG